LNIAVERHGHEAILVSENDVFTLLNAELSDKQLTKCTYFLKRLTLMPQTVRSEMKQV
jgi:hypothetical protein